MFVYVKFYNIHAYDLQFVNYCWANGFCFYFASPKKANVQHTALGVKHEQYNEHHLFMPNWATIVT